jgi:hypothetical protein
MSMTLERLDRMEREISRLNQEVLDLRAALTHARASRRHLSAVGAVLLLAGFFYQGLSSEVAPS